MAGQFHHDDVWSNPAYCFGHLFAAMGSSEPETMASTCQVKGIRRLCVLYQAPFAFFETPFEQGIIQVKETSG